MFTALQYLLFSLLCQMAIGINYNALQCLVCVKRVEFADDANFCSMLSLHCSPYFQNLKTGKNGIHAKNAV